MHRHPLTSRLLSGLSALAVTVPATLSAADGSQPAPVCGDGGCSVGGADAGLGAVHDCAGLNLCKGLGGCRISDDKLTALAAKRGVPRAAAGAAHDCAGLNACKGLGGCKVNAEKFVKLYEKRRLAESAKASL